MRTNMFNKLIEEFQELSIEEKEYRNAIFKKQITEIKRELLALRVNEAENNLKSGNIKSGNIKDLYEDLESDIVSHDEVY